MDETTQNLKKQFDALPSNVQKAISDVNLATKLQEIVKNNKLMIDQAGKIETETILVLFGLEPLDNYVANLIKNVGLSSIQASTVAHDVNESIFKSVRETLKTINDGMLKVEKERPAQQENPTRENVLAGIENPQKTKTNESSISISSLQSNSTKPEIHEEIDRGVEIKINDTSKLSSRDLLSKSLSSDYTQNEPLHLNIPDISKKTNVQNQVPTPNAMGEKMELETKHDNLPEVAPKITLPSISSLVLEKNKPYHTNISPVENIIESKLNNTVIVPKEDIIIEEKTKLPKKPTSVIDSYREPIN